MAHARTVGELVTVRDPATGREFSVRGLGSMKGQLQLREDIDLTKPIWEQAIREPKLRKRSTNRDKR